MKNHLLIEGKKYIRSREAAALTGYSLDYIGQLSRSGKIDSKLIGRTWFVAEESILKYKNLGLEQASKFRTSVSRDPDNSTYFGKPMVFEVLSKFAFVTILVLAIIISGTYSLSHRYQSVGVAARNFVDRFEKEVYVPTFAYLVRVEESNKYVEVAAGNQTASVLSSISSGLVNAGEGVRDLVRGWLGIGGGFAEVPASSSAVTVKQVASTTVVTPTKVTNKPTRNIVTRVVEQPTYVSNVFSDVNRKYVDDGFMALKKELMAMSTRSTGQTDSIYNNIDRSVTNITNILGGDIDSAITGGGSAFSGVSLAVSGNATVGGTLTVGSLVTGGQTIGGNFGVTGLTTLATTTASSLTADVFYGDGSNLTGITSFSTSTTRGVFSSSALGLDYASTTGIFSLTSGYNIPLTASTTEWANRATSQWNTVGSDINYMAGNVGIGTTTPNQKLVITSSNNYDGLTLSSAGAATTEALRFMDNSGISLSRNWAIVHQGVDWGDLAFRVSTTAGTDPYNQTAAIILKSSGNVGIGTTAPITKLHVNGGIYVDSTNPSALLTTANGQTASNVFHNSSNSTSLLIRKIGSGVGDYLSIEDSSNVAKFVVNSEGNVGIGSTTPSAKLTVSGDAYFGGNIAATGTVTALGLAAPAGSGALSFYVGGNLGGFFSSGAAEFRLRNKLWNSDGTAGGPSYAFESNSGVNGMYNNNGSLAFSTAATDRLFIASSTGNVGIGTTGPLVKFAVTGASQDIGDGSGTRGIAQFTTGTGAASDNKLSFGVVDGSYSWIQATQPGVNWRNLVLEPGGGNVGIGTVAPANPLEVNGKIGFTNSNGFVVGGTGVNANDTFTGGHLDSQFGVWARSTSGSSRQNGFDASTAGNLAFKVGGNDNLLNILSTGNVGIGTTSPMTGLQIASGSLVLGSQPTLGFINPGSANIMAAGGIITGYSSGSGGVGIYGNSVVGSASSVLGFSNGWIGSTFPAADTGFSRLSANKIAVGNGTSGDITGTLIAGNIGIGTTSPSAKLAITGTAGTGDIFAIASSTDARLLTVTSAGNVGIGTAVPTEKLQVLGNIYLTALTPIIKANGADFTFDADNNNNDTGEYFRWTINNSANEWMRLSNGNLGIGTTSPSAKLAITGTAGTGDIFRIASSSDASFLTVTSAGNALFSSSATFSGNNSSDGNAGAVMIGTTAFNEVYSQLHIKPPSSGVVITQNSTALASSGRFNTPDNLAIMGLGGNASKASVILGVANTNSTGEMWLYNTLTDSSNYNRGFVRTTGSAFNIGTENLGSGAALPLNLITASTTRMTIDTSGNVGIGTTSPVDILSLVKNSSSAGAAQFSVQNTNSSGDARFAIKNSGTGALGAQVTGSGYAIPNSAFFYTSGGLTKLGFSTDGDVASGGSGYITFGTGGYADSQERMRITSSGNVGIGTTTPSNKLEVAGNSYFGGNVTATGTINALALNLSSGTFGGALNLPSDGIMFKFAGSEYYDFNTTSFTPGTNNTIDLGSSAKAWKNGYFAGNVGIGTTSPSYKLDIDAGTASGITTALRLRAGASNTTSGPALLFQSGYTGYDWYGGRINTISTGYGLDTKQDMVFLTNNGGGGTSLVENMRITGAGNVGIGTTNPGAKLEVTGTSFLHGGVDIGDTAYYDSTMALSVKSNRSYLLGLFDSSASAKLVVTQAGNVGIGTTNPIYGKLQVNGSGTYGSGYSLYAGSGGIANSYLMSDGASGFNWMLTRAGTDTKGIVISELGNVGIGTTTPGQKLVVAGNGIIGDGTGGTNLTVAGLDGNLTVNDGSIIDTTRGELYFAYSVPKIINFNASKQTFTSTGAVTFSGSGSGLSLDARSGSSNIFTLYNTAGLLRFYDGSDRLTIAQNTGNLNLTTGALQVSTTTAGSYFMGSVGIGTTTPSTPLTIVANGAGSGFNVAGSNGNFVFQSGGVNGAGLISQSNSSTNGFVIGTNNGGTSAGQYLRLQTNNQDRLVINDSGNVGIGTTNPNTKLEVNGTASTTGLQVNGNINIAEGSVFQYGGNNMLSAQSSLGNIYIGNPGNTSSTGSRNVTLGQYSLGWTGAISGSDNTSYGDRATRFLTSGSGNTAMGSAALYNITSGSQNTAVGYYSLSNATSSSNNVGLGYWTLLSNTSGANNMAVGTEAMRFNTTGSYNLAIGDHSLWSNTTGSSNVGIGTNAGLLNATGTGNIFLGNKSGYNETGSNSFYVGNVQQASLANDKAYSLLYGTFSGTAGSLAGQQLVINGNVGIGTNAPTSILQLKSNTDTTLTLSHDLADAYISARRSTNNGTLEFYPGASRNYYFTGSHNTTGYVGIGTSNPTAPLHISKATLTSYQNLADNQPLFIIQNPGGSDRYGEFIKFTNGTDNAYIGLNGMGDGTVAKGLSLAVSTSTSALFINTSGNVGIGSTTPSSRLTVSGDTFLGGNVTATGTLTLSSGAGTYNNVDLQQYNGGLKVLGGIYVTDPTSEAQLYIKKGTTEFKFSADYNIAYFNGANLGIGSTTPSAKLTIKGNGTGAGVLFQTTNSGDSPKVTILDNGNIGFGTTSPSFPLSIVGKAAITDNLLLGPSGDNGTIAVSTGLIVDAGQTAKFRLLPSGNNIYFQNTNSSGDINFTGNNGVNYSGSSIFKGTSDAAIPQVRVGSGSVQLIMGELDSSYSWISSANSPLYLSNNGNNTIINPTAGNVGIGTTSPGALLHVNAGASQTNTVAGYVYGSTNSGQTFTDVAGQTHIKATMVIGNNWGNDNGNLLNIYSSTNDGILFVKGGGNIGIGTTNPLASLQIKSAANKEIQLGATAGNYTNSTYFTDLSSLNSAINFSRSDGAFTGSMFSYEGNGMNNLGIASRGAVKFVVGGTADRGMVITDTGNVGIGSTTPSSRLTVSGSTFLGGNVTATGTLALTGLSLSTTGNYLCIDTTTNQITSGTTCTLSSNRFKQNVQDLNLGLNTVLALRPVTFNFKQGYGDNGGTDQLGFVAEEADAIDGRLVPHDKNGLASGFNYANYTAVLTKAIQEQQVQINALKNATTTNTTSTVINTTVVQEVSATTTAAVIEQSTSFITTIANAVKDLIASTGEWVLAKVTSTLAVFNRVETQTAAVSQGLEMKDQATGTIYCVMIKNGDWDKRQGTCAEVAMASTTPTVATTTPATSVAVNPVLITPEPVSTTTPIVSTSTPEIATSTPVIATSTPEVATSTPEVVIPPVAGPAQDPVPTAPEAEIVIPETPPAPESVLEVTQLSP